MILGRPRFWNAKLGIPRTHVSHSKKTLDENHFKVAHKNMEGIPPTFKIGDRVYFKNKQPSKWDLKWRSGYRIV